MSVDLMPRSATPTKPLQVKAKYLKQSMTKSNNNDYYIAGKFGGELNLAVWRSVLQPPN